MKYFRRLFLVFMILILTAGCSQEGVYTLKVVQGGVLRISSGEELAADILLLDGELIVEDQAFLHGSLYQLLGEANVSGTVTGNITQWSGFLYLGPDSIVMGDYAQSGGDLDRSPEAAIRGEFVQTEVRLTPEEWFRQNIRDRMLWFGVQLLLLSFLAWGISTWYPRGVLRVRKSIQNHILVSLAMGALVGVVGLTLLVQMMFTIILIPVTLLGLVALGAGIALGWIGLGGWLGEKISSRLKTGWSIPVQHLVGTAVLMLGFFALNALPVLGGLIMVIIGLVSLGAVFLTRFGSRSFQPAPLDP